MGRGITRNHAELRMKISVHLCKSVFCVAFMLLFTSQLVIAQETPTPVPDGAVAITIEVQPNDSLWALSARANLSLQELLDLNGLTEDAVIQPGQLLIVGYTTPEPTPTVEIIPTATATLPPPPPTQTPIPPPPTGVCLTAFDDQNRNGMQDVGEGLKTAVAFTIFNDELVVANYVTDGVSEPYCLENMVEGEYHITRSVGPDEVLTTPGDRGILVRLGAMTELSFGSVSANEAVVGVETAVPGVQVNVEGETAVSPTQSTTPINSNETQNTSNRIFIFSGLIIALFLLFGSVFFIIRIRRNMNE